MALEGNKRYADRGDLIKGILQTYLHKWYLFVLGLLIALTLAYLNLRYTPKLYTSEAKINILDQSEGIELSSQVFKKSFVNVEKEIEILKSYPIIEQVVKNQDLTVSFFIEGNVQTTEVNTLPVQFTKTIKNEEINYDSFRIEVTNEGFEIYRGNAEEPLLSLGFTTLGVQHDLPFELNLSNSSISPDLYGDVYIVNFTPVANATKSLKNGVQVDMIGKYTEQLSLKLTGQSTDKNERILNELIRVFDQDGINDRRQVSLRTIQFIDARFESLAEELDSLETNIKEFKQKNQFISTETGGSVEISKLSQVEEQLFELENQLMLLGILKESIENSGTSLELLPANIGVNSGNVNGLVSQYNDLVLELQKYETSAGQNNPQVVILKEELMELKSNIIASINTLEIQLAATKAQVEKKNQQVTAEVFSMPAKEKMFLDIKRQQEIKQELYIYLLQKREEAAINYAITEPTIKVVEYALSSGWPVSPNVNGVYTKAILYGLGIPFALIYLFTLLDTKLKGRADIEKITNKIPIAAELPKYKKNEQVVFLDKNNNSNYAEAFRIMTHNLNYMLPPEKTEKGHVFYVTSTIKGEGKTYVSVNLSLALSSMNKKVLLIGGDLRNPQIHNFMGWDRNVEGLSKYLYDVDFDWKKGVFKGFEQHQNHHTLLSGSIPPNPANLLTNGRLKALLDEAKEEYDYIIVDTAPTILVSDTMLTSSLADVVVYVTRANFTEKKLLNYSKELSDSGKLKNMVYVINAIDKKSHGYGYKYGYNYGYGYGYGSKS